MYNVYLIKKGETLEDIADRFNTTINSILNLNDIDTIRDGDEIIIPSNASDYFEYYPIKKGDTLYAISKKYNINPDLLANLNGLSKNEYIYPNQVLLIPKSGYNYYITKEGDTLENVINLFGTTKDKFFKNNKTIYLLNGQLLVNKVE